MSPGRRAAFEVVRRVFERGAYADRALIAESRRLGPRDRALARAIAYGAVQRRLTLDHVAEGLLERPLKRLEPAVLAALRIGLFQLLYMNVAVHAAVDESVQVVKQASPRGAALVNAVLRRASREGVALLSGLGDRDPRGASLLHSVPLWLTELWWAELGADQARALLARVNEPAESALRVNSLVAGVDEVMARLPVRSHSAAALPEGIVLEEAFDAHGSSLWEQGAIMPQSRASMLVGRLVGPQARTRVLDLCAAPGGKTTHLAALMADTGEVVAVERHPRRARALEETCTRMHVTAVRVQLADAVSWRSEGQFDRVLVDPPCSGLGTLQSRPDLRWRASLASIAGLGEVQLGILRNAACATRLGAALTYSVCTISSRESEDVVERFLAENPAFEAEDLGAQFPQWSHHRRPQFLQLLPHRDLTDGFFIARLRRNAD